MANISIARFPASDYHCVAVDDDDSVVVTVVIVGGGLYQSPDSLQIGSFPSPLATSQSPSALHLGVLSID